MAELASRAKFNELIGVLQQAADNWVVPGPGMSDADVAEGFRNLSHILQSALYSHQEFDPERPVFNRIVSPTRSFTGDNSDALYFETPVAPGREYIVTGNPRVPSTPPSRWNPARRTAPTPPTTPASFATTTWTSTPTAITRSASAALRRSATGSRSPRTVGASPRGTTSSGRTRRRRRRPCTCRSASGSSTRRRLRPAGTTPGWPPRCSGSSTTSTTRPWAPRRVRPGRRRRSCRSHRTTSRSRSYRATWLLPRSMRRTRWRPTSSGRTRRSS